MSRIYSRVHLCKEGDTMKEEIEIELAKQQSEQAKMDQEFGTEQERKAMFAVLEKWSQLPIDAGCKRGICISYPYNGYPMGRKVTITIEDIYQRSITGNIDL